MELHQLRYFCAVADTGSFSRAAEQSHVSQPSLSQQILKLEDELGARLFDRLGRSVRLTELGKTFLPRARAVLRELEAAKGEVVEGKTLRLQLEHWVPSCCASSMSSDAASRNKSSRARPATGSAPISSRIGIDSGET